jgi:hypothetical protein
MRRVWLSAMVCACLTCSAQAGEQTAESPALPEAGLPASTTAGDACTTCDARQAAKTRSRAAKTPTESKEPPASGN